MASDTTDIQARIVNGDEQDDSIPFHRHCQKTVCSAYGYNGNGATWDTLTDDDSPLIHLNELVEGDWRERFHNTDNITEDLRSILELINGIAGRMLYKKSWTLKFKDNSGNVVGQQQISPWDDNAPLTYTFESFGRNITLTIDGKPLKFNTIKQQSGETLSVSLPKNTLTVNLNGTELGHVDNITMAAPATLDMTIPPQDVTIKRNKNDTSFFRVRDVLKNNTSGQTIDLGIDCNRLTSTDGEKTNADVTAENYVMVKAGTHVYHRTLDNSFTGNYQLRVWFNASQGYPTSENDVIQIEVHVHNNSSRDITMSSASISPSESDAQKVYRLTDYMTLEAGKTTVIVVRRDYRRKVVTWGIAYVYGEGVSDPNITWNTSSSNP